jgi:hypothetical protein
VKVLVVSHLYPAPNHPRHLFVHEQVKALRALGVEMKVVSPTGYAPRALWRAHPRLRRRGLTPDRATIDGIEIEYPRVPVLPRMALFAHSGEMFYATLRRRVPAWRAEGFDLIHAHQAMPDGAAAQRLAAALDVPYVVTVHGRDVNFHLPQGGAVATVTAATLRGAATVVAVSGTVARRLEGIVAPHRLQVNNNGIMGLDEHVSPSDFAPGKRLLLSVGYLYESKGNALVVQALGQLVERYPGLEYAIVGEGPLRASLEQLAAALNVSERVHFLGRLPHDELLALMARADAFVAPSAPEGFGLVYAEALSQGTPVVACRGEGPEDFVEDGVSGLLVPPLDVDAVVTAVDRLLDDPEAAAKMAAAGRERVLSLTWARNAAHQKEIYEGILQ